jgi:predicted TIM-barrel fold metal-dependent hydrolase
MRAYIATIELDNGNAVRFLEASSAACAASDHVDAKYIAVYNDYLSAAIADDPDRFVGAWHALQRAPGSNTVKDALIVARLPSRDEVKSFSPKRSVH